MLDLLIENVLFKDKPVNIAIKDKRIINISPDPIISPSKKTINASHLQIIPSLIDMQVHFREPGFEYKETIESGSKAAAAGGFTAVAIMPNTNPTIDSIEMINHIQERIDASSKVNVHIIPAMTKSLKGKEICDYKAYKKARIVAITDDGIGVQDDEVMEDIFKQAALNDLSILQHCEVNDISNGGSIHQGMYSKTNNLKGIPSSSEWEMIKRDIALLEKHGGHYHVLHVSSRKSIDLIRAAKKKGLNITCEVTPHHLFLCDENIKNANFKMNPPLRAIEDMIALQDAFLDGTIDIISTDHAPHSLEEKQKNIQDAPFGVIGLETSFPLLYSYFVCENRCSLEHIIKAMSTRASEIFKLERNEINEGAIANFCLIDPQKILPVTSEVLYSKSHNTPFMDHKLRGWPMLTIKDGEVIYER